MNHFEASRRAKSATSLRCQMEGLRELRTIKGPIERKGIRARGTFDHGNFYSYNSAPRISACNSLVLRWLNVPVYNPLS